MRHPGKIPWRRWKDTGKLDVSHLRKWGAKVWVKDLDHKEGKLSQQSWCGNMVGYLGARGYRVFDPNRGGVYLIRDVVFEEGTPCRRMNAAERTGNFGMVNGIMLSIGSELTQRDRRIEND